MVIYSKNELVFFDGIFNGLNRYEKNRPIEDQLHLALLKVKQGNGSYPFQSLSPIPKTVLKNFNWPIEFLEIANWIFFKLWTQIGSISYITMEIRLRIASNMLEKLFLRHVITKEEFIWLDNNLKINVRKLQCDLMDEGLPF